MLPIKNILILFCGIKKPLYLRPRSFKKGA
jgi:hypothetical protein